MCFRHWENDKSDMGFGKVGVHFRGQIHICLFEMHSCPLVQFQVQGNIIKLPLNQQLGSPRLVCYKYIITWLTSYLPSHVPLKSISCPHNIIMHYDMTIFRMFQYEASTSTCTLSGKTYYYRLSATHHRTRLHGSEMCIWKGSKVYRRKFKGSSLIEYPPTYCSYVQYKDIIAKLCILTCH